jgi:hypothetical protein
MRETYPTAINQLSQSLVMHKKEEPSAQKRAAEATRDAADAAYFLGESHYGQGGTPRRWARIRRRPGGVRTIRGRSTRSPQGV